MSNKEPVQTSFDLPELLDANFSVKSDAFAQAVLGEKVKPTYKRAFEGLMSKLTPVDIDELIKNDRPLVARLTPNEYKSMFPRDYRIPDIFEGAAEYYTEFSHIKVYEDGDTSKKPKLINVVDTAEILEDGSLQFLFTRGIMPHLNDMKSHWLVMSIQDFSRLSAKYSQHLFNMFSNWLCKDVVSTRVEIADLRVLLSVPNSYNNSRLMTKIIDVSIKEINDKTSMHVVYEPAKGRTGNAYQYLDFIVMKKESVEAEIENPDQLELVAELAVNQFTEQGVTDSQFNTIMRLRQDKSKPIYQEAMNAYFNMMIKIAGLDNTVAFDEILAKSISSGWVTNLEKEWFIDKTRSVKDNPVLGQTLPDEKKGKSPAPSTVEEALPDMNSEDVLKGAYKLINKMPSWNKT